MDVAQTLLTIIIATALTAVAGLWILNLEWRHQDVGRRAERSFEASARLVAAMAELELGYRDWNQSRYQREGLIARVQFHVAEVRVYAPDLAIETILASIEGLVRGITDEDRRESPALDKLVSLNSQFQAAAIAELSRA